MSVRRFVTAHRLLRNFVCVLVALVPASSAHARPAQTLGVYVGPGNGAAVGDFERRLGRPVGVVHDALAKENWDTLTDARWWLERWSLTKFAQRVCPNKGSSLFGGKPVRAQSAWPGDAYVDYVGLDVYDQSWEPHRARAAARWAEYLRQPNGLRWHRHFAAAHGKPMTFPEWGIANRRDGYGGGTARTSSSGCTGGSARTTSPTTCTSSTPTRTPTTRSSAAGCHEPRAASSGCSAPARADVGHDCASC